MSVSRSEFLGAHLYVASGALDCDAVANVVLEFLEITGTAPSRISAGGGKRVGTRTRKFTPHAFRQLVCDQRINDITVWNAPSTDRVEIGVFLRAYGTEALSFQPRHVQAFGVVDDPAVGHALRELFVRLTALYQVVQGSWGHYRGRESAAREVYGAAGPAENIDEQTLKRLHEDVMLKGRMDGALRRLYPMTIIGPELWAKLPRMPRFDPMPVVEDFGNCKLLRAWPTLCGPRDPEFLRGTRALREWLWPYTIQNPADHVDNDPL